MVLPQEGDRRGIRVGTCRQHPGRRERLSERAGKVWLDLKQKTFHKLSSKSGLHLPGTGAQKDEEALLRGMVGSRRPG